MNYLECKLKMAILRRRDPVPEAMLRKRIQPYADLFGLRLTNQAIEYPTRLSKAQAIGLKEDIYGMYAQRICYRSIVQIEEYQEGMYLLLRSGHWFFLCREHPVWKMTDFYHDGQLNRWWWHSNTRKRVNRIANFFKTAPAWNRKN